MITEKAAAVRAKQHTIYKNAAGKRLPGVTTVLGVLAKPALIPWANDLGFQHIKVREYVDVLGTIGTCAHGIITAHVQNIPFDTSQYPADIIDKAENSFLSYLEWEKQHKIEPILCEQPLVSEKWQYGGTIDFYGKIDGVLTLKDYKTAKAIWPEHLYQVAAYRELLEEHEYKVDAVGILQIGRAEDEGFSERVIAGCTTEWEIFKHCLGIYQLKK